MLQADLPCPAHNLDLHIMLHHACIPVWEDVGLSLTMAAVWLPHPHAERGFTLLHSVLGSATEPSHPPLDREMIDPRALMEAAMDAQWSMISRTEVYEWI